MSDLRVTKLANDPRVASLTTSAFVLWLLGRADSAVRNADEAIELALLHRLGGQPRELGAHPGQGGLEELGPSGLPVEFGQEIGDAGRAVGKVRHEPREAGVHGPEPGFREEPPPFGRSWGALYAVVAATLAALIVLFYAFTRALE